MVQICYWDVQVHVLQEIWWYPAHLRHRMEHRAEIFKPEEAGTVSLHGTALPRPAGWGLKRCCCIITALHALKLLSRQSWGVYSRLRCLCWAVEMHPKEGLWHSPCLSMSQGSSCLVVSVYESCAVIATSPLRSFRTTSMDPIEIAPHPASTVDNNSPPTKRQVKEIIPSTKVKIAPAVTLMTRLRKTQGRGIAFLQMQMQIFTKQQMIPFSFMLGCKYFINSSLTAE